MPVEVFLRKRILRLRGEFPSKARAEVSWIWSREKSRKVPIGLRPSLQLQTASSGVSKETPEGTRRIKIRLFLYKRGELRRLYRGRYSQDGGGQVIKDLMKCGSVTTRFSSGKTTLNDERVLTIKMGAGGWGETSVKGEEVESGAEGTFL